jgi:predicted transcriptional regulator
MVGNLMSSNLQRSQYDAVLSKNGKCTIAELAKEAKISRGAAYKAILL